MDNDDLTFGGSLLGKTTNPKRARPIDPTLPIHVVLKATRSAMRSPKHKTHVDALVADVAAKRGVRIFEYANVGNHLHLLIQVPTRAAWSAFIRDLSGQIARSTGVPWAQRPFTRVVGDWERAYRAARAYVTLNRVEADGQLSGADSKALRALRRLNA